MASSTAVLRKTLCAEGLVRIVRDAFGAIPDRRRQGSVRFSLPDTLMAALAMFQFKSPSLLHFDEHTRGAESETLVANLRRLYRLAAVPSDTQMRAILDAVPFSAVRPALRAVHSAAQRGRILEDFKLEPFGDRLLLAIDGTGLFSSTAVRCPQCGVKKRSKGTVEYYHQLLAAVMLSPDVSTVLPVDFEPIIASDGQAKDCSERNAAKRLVRSIAAQYPKRRFLVLEDSLSANGPHITVLLEHAMDFIIVAKESVLERLYSVYDARQRESGGGEVVEFERTDERGVIRGVRFANDLPLNAAHESLRVNLLEFWEVTPATKRKEEKTSTWAWITSLEIDEGNALEIARAGRTRWGVENQTFNCLKNQGYHLEHSYGHGKEHLSSTLAGLMLLSFLFDQVQEHACAVFQAARRVTRRKDELWSSMRTYLRDVAIESWEVLFGTIGRLGPRLRIGDVPDTG